jgi:hypothetical protein
MAAGADQQLIATKLQESHEVNSLPAIAKEDVNVPIKKDTVPNSAAPRPSVEQSKTTPGTLLVPHGLMNETETVVAEPKPIEEPSPPTSEPAKEPPLPQPEPVEDIILTPTSADSSKKPLGKAKTEITDEPLLGGILNATSDQAAEDAKRELDEQQNQTILAHSYLKGSGNNPINSASQLINGTKPVDIFADTSPVDDIPSVGGLPLPPPLPNFSTLPPSSTVSPTPDISASPTEPAYSSTLPSPLPDGPDPTQFQIPM